jgi:hypothetical protein
MNSARWVGPRAAGGAVLGAEGWDLVLVLDADGRVSPETRGVFEIEFQERSRRLRCRPADPAVGTLNTMSLAGSGELSGGFDIELAHCEDAETGTPLRWQPRPFVLHGNFDRLPIDSGAERP